MWETTFIDSAIDQACSLVQLHHKDRQQLIWNITSLGKRQILQKNINWYIKLYVINLLLPVYNDKLSNF